MDIGKKIIEARKAKGWNRDVLVEKSGVARRTIQNVENGYPCTVTTLTKLAKALEFPPAYFLS